VIAAPDRPPMVNPTGNASLAGAGTGDVLAGWLAGMWAQCRDEEAHRSGFSSAAAAAFLHGAAADPSGQISVRANDLIERIQAVWANGHFLPRRTPGPG
jgi:NAD(P)H-hydrate repair Nnr-like enzyme with NAD(P)H-hydrate dehydratase domain